MNQWNKWKNERYKIRIKWNNEINKSWKEMKQGKKCINEIKESMKEMK